MKHIVLLLSILFFSGSVFAKEQSAILSVPSMNCAACPVTVKKALQRVDGVTPVNVIFKRKTAEISFNDETVSVSGLQKATKNAGYPSHFVEVQK